MKYPSLMLLTSLFVMACGGNKSGDPAAELATLKGEKTKIEARIAELEKQMGAATPVARRVRTVGVTEVATTAFKHFIDLQGKVSADESVMATARMPGSLRRVYVDNGSVVRKGQLLAEVDDALLVKGMAELEGQLRTAEELYNRQKSLWDQKIGTEVQFIQAKTAKESLERSLATMHEQQSMYRIYAPVGGTVDMVTLRAGQAIAPGAPLCYILNLSSLKIKGDVTEAYAAQVRSGDRVQVLFPDLNNREISTTVKYVSKSINPMTRTFTVECYLPNGADYRANQVAVMKIVDYQNANAVVVPVNLIQTDDKGDFVLALTKTGDKEGTVRKVPVQQGRNYNGMVEIKSGLQKGDFLVSTGYQEVNDGEKVAF